MITLEAAQDYIGYNLHPIANNTKTVIDAMKEMNKQETILYNLLLT